MQNITEGEQNKYKKIRRCFWPWHWNESENIKFLLFPVQLSTYVNMLTCLPWWNKKKPGNNSSRNKKSKIPPYLTQSHVKFKLMVHAFQYPKKIVCIIFNIACEAREGKIQEKIFPFVNISVFMCIANVQLHNWSVM